LAEDSGVDFAFSPSSSDTKWTAQRHHPGLENAAAAELILNLVRESVEYAPTLVVWLIDQSRSVQSVSRELRDFIGERYRGLNDLAISGDSQEPQLLTAVCTFGKSVEFPLDTPSPDPQQVVAALRAVRPDETGREMTFTAIQTCLSKYLPFRTEHHCEVILVLLTDEAGDDRHLVEQFIPVTRQSGIPIYVLGVPAPFGRPAALDELVEATSKDQRVGDWRAIRQGPESMFPERIQLGFCDGATQLELIDSGFGPFALEYLCRASGGRFLALRPRGDTSSLTNSGEWPALTAYSFAPDAMRHYTPDYISRAEYQQLLEENAARQALHEAARMTGLEIVEFPRLKFRKRSEADLSRQLRLAQQSAAKLEPVINAMLTVLEQGEAARDELTRPRWQAAYDLALGRATAAKARIDGYNVMLAALKRGKNFEAPGSTTWVLQHAETIQASSTLRRLVEESARILHRVVKDHPGTPWAALAQHELRTPAGWKWTESE
jgi:hypothetical protein